jgi:WD repeat-containing protein 81
VEIQVCNTCFYKLCVADGNISADRKGSPNISLVKYDTVVQDIITRTFGCPIISLNPSINNTTSTDVKTKMYEAHCNVLPAMCALEMDICFLIIQQPYICNTLQDCVTFSPAMLGTSHAKPMFIIYQILQAMRAMHDRGLVLGDITLNDILVTENLWIQVRSTFLLAFCYCFIVYLTTLIKCICCIAFIYGMIMSYMRRYVEVSFHDLL